MQELLNGIAGADQGEIEVLLNAVLKRYAVLFPDWELSTISLQKSGDKNAQLDKIITLLQNMKTSP